ncbi:Transcriptional regulator [Frankia canadensis]|uniref:Transcriptional regulator n=1 Tax=Frankia canadensis TaxID=1836972 RepID=A0A2I2L236_9ACTN|nr:TetR/AcrR family transcriptional regulator [Frankia canadensis]SNQ51927.1 Transcriptional regulator [Frankia canadensis]SOU59217.1 Transcriptional regulator [Frankia canadensis]
MTEFPGDPSDARIGAAAGPRGGRGAQQRGGRSTYHHGDLAAALVEGTLDLIAQGGLAAFSVAALARRLGVSSAAPYRHFPDRESLLAAAALRAAGQLTERMAAAAAGADPADPVERLAATAGAYTRFVIERRAGLDLLFNPELPAERHPELAAATRALLDLLLPLLLAVPTVATYRQALVLFERHLAQAHGHAVFHLDGVFAPHDHDAERSVAAAIATTRSLVAGHAATP